MNGRLQTIRLKIDGDIILTNHKGGYNSEDENKERNKNIHYQLYFGCCMLLDDDYSDQFND
jgi:hypothetical protein